ncbi:MAG: hypothetical protein MRY83_01695 [Flavobacteriales bacterium]|nr:hypothetical protein [Flavobacteriales bacterium]
MRAIFTILLISTFSGLYSQIDSLGVKEDSLTEDIIEQIPVTVANVTDLESDVSSQNVSSFLQSSRDIFANTVGFNLSLVRYRIRGYDSENFTVMMNGVPMNDVENGWGIWSRWGGLNDVTRYQYSLPGVQNNENSFTGVAGFSNVNMRASSLRKGTRASYAITNRSYRHRLMVTHNTGMQDNGWAFSGSGSIRYAEEGYVEGTFYESASYFLSAEKKLNSSHSLGFIGFGSIAYRGRQGLSVQEAYDLTGNNYYNTYWGYQGGEKRNARVRHNHLPTVMLSHYWKVDSKAELTSSFYTQFGRQGNSNLNWYDTRDPRPDYYRYLPSYNELEDPEEAERQRLLWTSGDPSTQQLDWDFFYFANSKNLYTVEDADGIIGNNVEGNRSKFIVEEYRQDPLQIGINSVYNRAISDNININLGINGYNYRSRNYRKMLDLLGGDFWVDVDQFAEQDFADPSVAQNDLENPNGVIRKGDVFGYDYDIVQNYGQLFGSGSIKMNKYEAYASLMTSFTSFYREGNMQNGRFPDNSLGKSEIQNFFNYGTKLGAIYKISGRHYLGVNGQYQTRAPYSRNSFVSPRTRNDVVQGLENEEILGGDINYHIRYAKIKGRITGYYSEINNSVTTRSYYHDEFRNFVNYTMTGVDRLYQGIEAGIEGKIGTALTVKGAFGKGQFIYNSRPTATITVDNSSEVLAENRTVYIKNFRLGRTPQTVGSIDVSYRGAGFWFAGANINYFQDFYLDVNPDRRTEEALSKFVESDDTWEDVINQTTLDQDDLADHLILNIYGGKSFKLNNKYYLNLNVNINNALNNQNIISGGFEQLRYDVDNLNKFPPRIAYAYGLSYFLSATLRFK